MSRISDGERMKCFECEQPTFAIYALIPQDDKKHVKKVIASKRYCMNCDKFYNTRVTMVVDEI